MADLICPGCYGRFYETTELFDASIPPNGAMFKLKQPYRDWGWCGFPPYESTPPGDLECPGCGVQYVKESTNRVTVDVEDIDAQALAMHKAGKKPGEIGKALGEHHLKIVSRLKAMGEW